MKIMTVRFLAVFGLGAVCGAPAVTEAAPSQTPVKTARARVAVVSSRYFVPGTVRSAEDTRIATEVSGKLEWVLEPGTRVDAGDAVARIDASRLRAQRTRQEAEVQRLRSLLQLRKRYLDRQQKVDEMGAVIGVELDQAKADLEMASYQLAGAQAELRRLEEDIRRTRIVAPFAGQVVERLAQRGEYPREGTPIVRLVAVDRIEVWADAPVSDAENLRPGVQLPIRRGKVMKSASVEAVVQSGTAARRVVSLRLSLEGPTEWRIGAAVEVGIPGERSEPAVVVPRDSLVLREEGAHVIVVDEEFKAHRVPVEVGLGEGEWIAVVGDVRPGQSVVRRGAENLEDGQSVKVIEADS
ncbi:MAG: efflux RND transporter periplasmic adaptor subunit [Myxococcota bacterium]